MIRTAFRRSAPLLAAGALLAPMWLGSGPAAASTTLPSVSITASGSHRHHDGDDYDDQYHHHCGCGHYGEDGRYYPSDDADLGDYPDCDRWGDGYGCPEYGYPPQR